MTFWLFSATIHRTLALTLAVTATLALAAPSSAPAQDTGFQPAAPGEVRVNGQLPGLPALDAAGRPVGQGQTIPNFRDYYRETVTALADYARGRRPDFIILTREGLGLLLKSQREADLEEIISPVVADPGIPATPRLPVGAEQRRFIRAIDGVVMNDQYCGERVTASNGYITMMRNAGLAVLSVDHCGSADEARTAWMAGRRQGVLAHVDGGTGPMATIPATTAQGENPNNVTTLGEARNLLVVDDNAGYVAKDDLLAALSAINHDVLVLDAFHRDRTPLTPQDVRTLRFKHLGARRLVLARLDISRASDTRWYWNEDWKPGSPNWLLAPVLERPGTYEAAVWAAEWRDIIGRTLSGLMDLGFDGVVIEGIDDYQILEARIPLE